MRLEMVGYDDNNTRAATDSKNAAWIAGSANQANTVNINRQE